MKSIRLPLYVWLLGLLTTMPALAQFEEPLPPPAPRWQFHTQAGASWLAGPQGGAQRMVLVPQVSYRTSGRWVLRGGLALSNVRFMPRGGAESLPPAAAPLYGLSAFSGVSYLATDRLTLSGYVSYDATPFAGSHASISPFAQPGQWSASFQADYKISEHLSVGVGITQRRGLYSTVVPGTGFGNRSFPGYFW